MEEKSLSEDYFKQVYEANDDPWNFKSSEYESAKYDATISALSKNNYKKGLEIGCSIGILTNSLAKKCSELTAIDISAKALKQAEDYCKDLKNVKFQKLAFPKELPEGKFDLMVVSEVAYYLTKTDWEKAIESLYIKMNFGAQIILVHWLPEVHDYPQTGDEVHNLFLEVNKDRMKNVFSAREEKYRIDVWER